MKHKLLSAFLGCLLGGLFTFSPGTGFVLILILITSLLFWLCAGIENRRFIVALFLIGFLVRSILSLSLDALAWRVEGGNPSRKCSALESNIGAFDRTRAYIQIPDSDYYSQRGYALSQYAKGTLKSLPPYYEGDYGWHGYLHVIASFYYLFDYSPTAVKLFNCFLGALLGPVFFLLANTCFNLSIARWAAFLVTFFPSLVLWSTTNLKEPSLILLTVLLLLFFFKMQNSHRFARLFFYGMLFFLTFLAHRTLRSPIYTYALFACLLVSAYFTSRIPKVWKYALITLMLAGALFDQQRLHDFFAQSFMKHLGQVGTPGTIYKYLPEEFYDSDRFSRWIHFGRLGMPVFWGTFDAIFHYFLEPLPWKINTLFMSLTFPQMVFWYFSLPFAFSGMVWALRWNFRNSFSLVSIFMVWTVLSALASGNIGTVFRIRDMVTPFSLLFTCVGVRVVLNGRGELQPSKEFPK